MLSYPFIKKGDRQLVQHYRPISLLSVLSKVVEKAMQSRFLNFLNQNKFFSPRQYGFIKGKNTENAVSSFVEGVYNRLNNNKKTSGIFIDFAKAFDLVDHSILLNNLELAGIRDITLKWFESYLSSREQKVRIQNSYSNPKIINIGVPQGSVLSVYLFLIFINDLLFQSFEGDIIAFADDIALQYSKPFWGKIWDSMNCDLKTLNEWCCSNKMIVNASKTKFINFDFRLREVIHLIID